MRISFLVLVLFLIQAVPSTSAESLKIVYLIPIEGVIDLGIAPYIKRVIDTANSNGASAIILDIDTLGGRVDAALLIRDAILSSKVPTIAFINSKAISAGALIALGAEKIAVTEGSTIGAATPVSAGSPSSEPATASEKTISYVRSEFRATAERRGHPALLVEAMVDPDVEIPGIIAKGKLLTLTSDEALKYKLADFEANSLAAVLKEINLEDAEIRRSQQNWAERLVRLFTHPVASSLLMTIGLLGIMVEIRTPGFGVPGLLGLGSLALFFWGHWIVRLAGWEELLLLGIGLLLLALEIFVFPGFGAAGALGILAVVGGLALSLVGAGATWSGVIAAVGRVSLSLVGALGLGAILLLFLPRLPVGRSLVLQSALGDAAQNVEEQRWLGQSGTAVSPLRPAGIALISGQRLDVVSDGEMVAAGEPIIVMRVDGNRIVVRRMERSS
jgi:membrane-bound serine protease (ClpP class)